MTKTEALERMKQARKLLDDVYYWTELSENDNLKEINRLMTWADSSIMEAEQQIEIYFGE